MVRVGLYFCSLGTTVNCTCVSIIYCLCLHFDITWVKVCKKNMLVANTLDSKLTNLNIIGQMKHLACLAHRQIQSNWGKNEGKTAMLKALKPPLYILLCNLHWVSRVLNWIIQHCFISYITKYICLYIGRHDTFY